MNPTALKTTSVLPLVLVLVFGLPEPVMFWMWLTAITGAIIWVMVDILSLIAYKLSSHLTEEEQKNLTEIMSIGAITVCATIARSLIS